MLDSFYRVIAPGDLPSGVYITNSAASACEIHLNEKWLKHCAAEQGVSVTLSDLKAISSPIPLSELWWKLDDSRLGISLFSQLVVEHDEALVRQWLAGEAPIPESVYQVLQEIEDIIVEHDDDDVPHVKIVRRS